MKAARRRLSARANPNPLSRRMDDAKPASRALEGSARFAFGGKTHTGTQATQPSFNGTMVLQPWIPRARSRGNPCGYPCFNGAMTFQPWMPEDPTAAADAIVTLLQWSHDLSAMDTNRTGPGARQAGGASMEP